MLDLEEKLLVSHPRQYGNIFTKSVVLITEHNSQNSVGFIINRLSGYTLNDVLEEQRISTVEYVPVFLGGDYSVNSIFMIHSTDWQSINTTVLDSQVCISSDIDMLSRFSKGDRPKLWRFTLGMSMWEPYDLEYEINEYSNPQWLICSPNNDIIYNHWGNEQWHRSIDQCSREMQEQFF